MVIDKKLLDNVSEQAKASPRLRMNYNFHQSLDEKCHRFLNAVEPGTEVPIHKHPTKDETFVIMLGKKVECRPVWKPMHKQPVYKDAPIYTNGVEEDIFKIGMCLPAGPYVTDEDVQYIVQCIKEAIE